MKLLLLILMGGLMLGGQAVAETLNVPVTVKQANSSRKGSLEIRKFPKTIVNHMSFPATIFVDGKSICTGKIRTQGYQAYYSGKCYGKAIRGSGTINRTIRVNGRTINFIKKLSMKAGKTKMEIITH